MDKVEAFWDKNPVAAAQIKEEFYSESYYKAFDAMREADNCEPYAFSNMIHNYEGSRGLKVLDIGCGNGYVLAQYAHHGAVTTGLDVAGTAVAMSQRRFELMKLKGCFVKGDNDGRLPFSDESFDIICSMGVLHHTPLIDVYLDEAERCLKPGGRLIIMLYNKNSYRYRVLFWVRRWCVDPFKGKTIAQICNMNDGSDCPLALAYTKVEAVRMLESRKLERIDVVFNKLSYEEIFLFLRSFSALFFHLKKLGLFTKSSGSWAARKFGWNMYLRAVKRGAI